MAPRIERAANVIAIGLTSWLWPPAMAVADSGDVGRGARVFLLDPEIVIPGNQMGFFGLPDARDRADLIAYLKDAAQRQ